MKLRNKKTGNIGDYLCAIQGDDIKLWSATNSYETYHYKCMSEFINEWEDYKPKEPLEGSLDYDLFVIDSQNADATQEQLRDSMKDALEQIISRLNKLEEDK